MNFSVKYEYYALLCFFFFSLRWKMKDAMEPNGITERNINWYECVYLTTKSLDFFFLLLGIYLQFCKRYVSSMKYFHSMLIWNMIIFQNNDNFFFPHFAYGNSMSRDEHLVLKIHHQHHHQKTQQQQQKIRQIDHFHSLC